MDFPRDHISGLFTLEFKDEVVRQITESGYSVADVSERLSVSAHSLYKWVTAAKPDKSEHANELAEAKGEILKLKAQLRRTEEERDILKKAAASSTGRCNILHDVSILDEGTRWQELDDPVYWMSKSESCGADGRKGNHSVKLGVRLASMRAPFMAFYRPTAVLCQRSAAAPG